MGQMSKGVTNSPLGEVIVYEAPDGEVQVDVRLERETVWLTQRQMAELFDSSTDNVGLHLKNIFSDNELEETATTEDFSVVQTEGKKHVKRRLKHYNLDAIISVGYRVNSRRGVRFRQWATRTLRDHLLSGYTLNERRLRERGLGEIEQAVKLLARTLTDHALVTDEGRAVLEVVHQYTRAWRLLLEYDEERLTEGPLRPIAPTASLTFEDAAHVGADLRVRPCVDGAQAGSGRTTDQGAHIGAPLPVIVQWFKTMTTNEFIRGVEQRGWPAFSGRKGAERFIGRAV